MIMQIRNQKMKVLYLASSEKTNSGKDLSKIEARLAESKQKMSSLKIKF